MLILVKHSLPLVTPLTPAATWQLAPQGVARCAALAEALAPYLPAVLLSSAEPKARATAAYLAQQWSIRLTVVAGLEEHHRQTTPFLSDDDFHQAVQQFFAHPSDLILGEETADGAYHRFAHAVTELHTQYLEQTIIVVTHGTVLSLYLSRQVGIDPFSIWQQLGLPSFVVFDHTTQMITAARMHVE